MNISSLLPLAVAPSLICLFYIYIRDKYEKEPVRLLIIGVIYGIVITFPIIQAETFVAKLMPHVGQLTEAFYISFAVAALVEELFKFIVLYFLTWRNNNLNERFDGIVYSVFISLGFAGLENILYVLNPDLGGLDTALSRAFISVPSHGFFGIVMGYYFALAKFENHNRKLFMFKAFLFTYLIHGIFDFILLSGYKYYMLIFIPFLCVLWVNGFKKMNKHIQSSPFRKNSA